MHQNVIPLFPRGAARRKLGGVGPEPGEPARSRSERMTQAAGIVFCLESLLKDAEAAGLSLTMAGLRVAIDAATQETITL